MQTLGIIIAERRRMSHKTRQDIAMRVAMQAENDGKCAHLSIHNEKVTKLRERLRLHELGLLVFDAATEKRICDCLNISAEEYEAWREVPRAISLREVVRRRRLSLSLNHTQLVRRMHRQLSHLHCDRAGSPEAALAEHDLDAYERGQVTWEIPLLFVTLTMLDYDADDAQQLIKCECARRPGPDNDPASVQERLATVAGSAGGIKREELLQIMQEPRVVAEPLTMPREAVIRNQLAPAERVLFHKIYDEHAWTAKTKRAGDATRTRLLTGKEFTQGFAIITGWRGMTFSEMLRALGPAEPLDAPDNWEAVPNTGGMHQQAHVAPKEPTGSACVILEQYAVAVRSCCALLARIRAAEFAFAYAWGGYAHKVSLDACGVRTNMPEWAIGLPDDKRNPGYTIADAMPAFIVAARKSGRNTYDPDSLFTLCVAAVNKLAEHAVFFYTAPHVPPGFFGKDGKRTEVKDASIKAIVDVIFNVPNDGANGPSAANDIVSSFLLRESHIKKNGGDFKPYDDDLYLLTA
jgi:hypothetical protein